jgi:peptide/nickel transport system substrate-binding protein
MGPTTGNTQQGEKMTDQRDVHNRAEQGLTRRRLLELGAQGAMALSGASLLAACGGSSSGTGTSATSASGAGTPRRGGQLTVGMIGAGSEETVNPGLAGANPDTARVLQLYDPLFAPEKGGLGVVPALALSAEANSNATRWTLKLREGVTFHDGKPFTADDVIFTMRSWQNKANYANAVLGTVIDFPNLRKRDSYTVEVPLLLPLAQFPTLLTSYNTLIVQDGETKFTNPVGTGPFKFKSFTPGQQSVFIANPHYWIAGKPYVDQVTIDTTFSADTARLNALMAGTINVMHAMPYSLAKAQSSSGDISVLASKGGNPFYFVMRVDVAPLNDVRVRTAIKLIADRPALVSNALNGYGVVGNDLFGDGEEYFDSSASRSQDIEQAKSLLKAAGQENLTLTLQCAETSGGLVPAATLLAEQAQAAGVKINVKQEPPGTFFLASSGFLSRPFQSSDIGAYFPSLTALYRAFLITGAPYPETHYGNPTADKLTAQAAATLDKAKAQELWAEVQKLQFEKGGNLVYSNGDYVDATSSSVHGIVPSPATWLGNYSLLDTWVTQ